MKSFCLLVVALVASRAGAEDLKMARHLTLLCFLGTGSLGAKLFKVSNDDEDEFLPKSSLFGMGGKSRFRTDQGPGYVGGAVATMPSVQVAHRYLKYLDLNQFKDKGSGGTYDNGASFVYWKADSCDGACPTNSYCDYGFCRCVPGLHERYGHCLRDEQEFNKKWTVWRDRLRDAFVYNEKCERDETCTNIDINLACNSGSGSSKTCGCRKEMRWNKDMLECQLFVDVDCSTYSYGGSPAATKFPAVTDKSQLAPAKTLAGSELTTLVAATATKPSIKSTFCLEVKEIEKKFKNAKNSGNGNNNNGGGDEGDDGNDGNGASRATSSAGFFAASLAAFLVANA